MNVLLGYWLLKKLISLLLERLTPRQNTHILTHTSN